MLDRILDHLRACSLELIGSELEILVRDVDITMLRHEISGHLGIINSLTKFSSNLSHFLDVVISPSIAVSVTKLL